MDDILLDILVVNNVEVVDSRLIAKELGISHAQFYRAIKDNQTEIEEAFGSICFKTETRKRDVGAVVEKFAYLNENQATYLMTLSRNTPEVKRLKLKLVKSFAEMKNRIKNPSLDLETKLLLMEKENETLKLKLELEATKIALNMMNETLEKNENTIKQSMELISIQEEKNFENNYYLTKLVEIKEESLLFSTLLDLKWDIKLSSYSFPTVSYTVADLIRLFSIDDTTSRKIAPFISKIYILDHKTPPSKKEETYRYTGDDLLYPITVFKILTNKEWKEFRDAIEIDYKLRFPSSNRPFLPPSNS